MDDFLEPLIVNTDEEMRVVDVADLTIREQIVSNAPTAI